MDIYVVVGTMAAYSLGLLIGYLIGKKEGIRNGK